jgi:hypothetical protein
MTEPTYNIKEIIDLQFKNLSREMGDIKRLLENQNVQTDKQFARLDAEMESIKKEVGELKQDNARYKTIWGIGATVGASLIAFFMNKIF